MSRAVEGLGWPDSNPPRRGEHPEPKRIYHRRQHGRRLGGASHGSPL